MIKRPRTLHAAAPPVMATASLFTPIPSGYVRIMIARGPFPKGIDLHTMRYATLIPQWSPKDTPPDVFHRHYINRLGALDPEFVFADLKRMGGSRIPVLCGYPGLVKIAAGHLGCHRHLVAQWFERALDIKVPELGAPASFDRMIWWRLHPIKPAPPGERPRTGPQPTPQKSKADRAKQTLAQYKFKF